MPDTFTPEQISQILEEFFKVVGTRQYIGARYVPIFGRKDEDSIEWDNTAPYEPLTIVLYQGNSYTSRQFVPIGVEITNQEFWAITGNYNAQVEMYRRETAAAREVADNALTAANNAQTDINTLLPKADFSAESTVKKYVDDSVAEVQGDIDTLLPKADFSAENTVKKYVDDSVAEVQGDIDTLLPKSAFSAENTVKKYVDKFSGPSSDLFFRYRGAMYRDVKDGSYHAGAIADAGSYQVIISSPTAINTSDLGIVEFVSINDNTIEFYPTKTAVLGHANSLAYDPLNHNFYVAPVYTYTSGSRENTNQIYKYNQFFDNMTRINAPETMMGVSYDRINAKLYCYSYTGNIYEIKNDAFELISNISYIDYFNQDFAVYDGVFYQSSPSCVIRYGNINTGEVHGYYYCGDSDPSLGFRIFGELDGFEFDATGHLLTLGDYYAGIEAANGRITTISRALLPNLPSYEVGNVPTPVGYTRNIDPLSKELAQGGTLVHPNMLFMLPSNIIAGITRLNLLNDVDSQSQLYFARTSQIAVTLNAHTLATDKTVRLEASKLSISGSGTFRANRIFANGSTHDLSFFGGCTLESLNESDSGFFAGFSAGSTFNFGGCHFTTPIKLGNTTFAAGHTYIISANPTANIQV